VNKYCGMKNTCAWKKESLLAHYAFVFFLWWLVERFRVEQGLNVSFESLWWEFCKGVYHIIGDFISSLPTYSKA